ncbi:MAG: glycosyltransferase [Patescibacteria group bacterium]|jgi:UDP-N-acetylglucosamine--N-acetylmuramyl-(pentapeptide) pyrophosphoryl-undecaprenol N-acetylglucosamine transferase
MKLLFVGGGTLGSVNPLLACSRAIAQRRPDIQVKFWGRRVGLEKSVVQAAGMPYSWIPAGKYRQYFSLQNFLDICLVACAVVVAWFRLLLSRPAAVVTAGSYVAVPVAWAAASLGIPVVLYQQDMQVGLANRLIAKVAKLRTAALPEQAAQVPGGAKAIGFVLRADLQAGKASQAAQTYGLDAHQPTVVVVGGSSGARDLNAAFLSALPLLPSSLQVLHITGEQKAAHVNRPGYVAISFTNENLPDVYALATMVITRAGMNVLAELVALQKPAIIVPLPGTHQEQNAKTLAQRGAVVLQQAECTPEKFAGLISRICADADYRTQLSTALAGSWSTAGASTLAEKILSLV